ncbi:MAG TPA: hypothetical protein VH458_22635 [Vicinamibacterales bacterium]
MQRALEEHRACRREIQRLTLENARLAVEVEQLRGLNDDLRGSAEIWIRLYEAQLSGKNHHANGGARAARGSGPCRL